ncbi:MAG: hypothetical protein CVT70_09880 [Alphaproteobacteria bacterium HGW-Alphaproteobacteria-1]|jgi:uncharacterized protein (TIGR02231 family)|nr:MAG: hypothetical protein CVT70_09880 [Alphaproteobacteria bacterium HGW-Alphaproteobacteria-1]
MRALTLCLACLPLAALADDIPLTSRVSAVTLYPQGASVTREAPFAVPAGAHDLILADLPEHTPLAAIRVTIDDARMGGVSTRNDYVPPRPETESAAYTAAKAEVERLQDALRTARAGVADIRLEAEAASARIAFLDGIGRGDGLAALGPDALRDLAGMIGTETLAARRESAEATRRAETAERGLKDLMQELARAEQALKALVPETEARAMLAVSVTADTALQGTLRVAYTVPDAGWQPLYDLHLARDSGALRIERGAFVHQHTGENWRDVALTLSTRRPSEQGEPGDIWPWIPRLADPEEITPMPRMKAEGVVMMSAPMLEGTADMARPEFDGMAVSYAYPAPVNVATGADRVRLMLPPLDAQAGITARAVPLMDETAFLVARVTIPAEEVLLPTPEARFYLDGRYTGQRWLPLVAGGDAADLAFGPIEGLRLTRVIRARTEGDRGLITRATEAREEVEIAVENLTGTAWPVHLLDRVPVSEQTDLRITWEASPPPDERDVEDRRGVLGWRFDLPAGERRAITLNTRMNWPEGKVVR